MWHEMMILLIAVVVAATVQPASATASTLIDVGTRRSLWQARHIDGLMQQAAMDSIDSDETIESYAIIGNIHRRQLRHGKHKRKHLPFCNICRFHGKTGSHTYRKGHCKSGGKRRTCYRRTGKAKFLVPPGQRNSTAPNGELIVAVQVPERNTSTVVVGVGCFSDADCELSANTLAPITGTMLVSNRGVVTGKCVGIVRNEEQPGTCFCAYTAGSVKGGGAEQAEQTAGMASGNERQSVREDTSHTSQVRNAHAMKFDLCVRESLADSASIVTDSSGSPRLMNRTASGVVMLDVELRQIEEMEADDYEYTEDMEAEGFIVGYGSDFSPDELGDYDNDGVEPDDDDQLFTSIRPATPPSRPVPTRSTNESVDNEPASTPAPGGSPPPRSTPAREVATSPTPATAPTPSVAEDTPTRARGSRANRRSVNSEEIDITMRFQDA